VGDSNVIPNRDPNRLTYAHPDPSFDEFTLEQQRRTQDKYFDATQHKHADPCADAGAAHALAPDYVATLTALPPCVS
jgi:hypothetical protein